LKARVDRYKKAITERAVSEQDYDEAISALDRARATIAAREAEVESARINLDYTRITAPISPNRKIEHHGRGAGDSQPAPGARDHTQV